ncbi:J domain-containing protein [Nitrosomonas sp. Is37]|uniref:J domain-containing protein n=1 Tax=Nitrosomonas sp. Is37 TaxID=3080535 RepID=UPI00294A9D2F|nr:J domain-containing protein [Nitrosomonas sp. Is37]MDV6345551.1 J domain-containing protein [Nitrosomonas sp. Is37]
MTKFHTHYDNLRVARNAPPKAIRAAYKRLSQRFHPDKNPGDADAARIMAIINTSYQVLSDPDKRREHDEWIAGMEAANLASRQTSEASYSTIQHSAQSASDMALLEILLPIFNPIKGIVIWTIFYIIGIGVITGAIWLIGSAVDLLRGKS